MAKKRLPVIMAVVLCCSVLVGVALTIDRSGRIYEIEPEVVISAYRTDAARAIDAYERLMERYLDLTEANLIGVGSDVRAVAKKLDRMDSKLTELSERLDRIEKALGVAQVEARSEQMRGDSKRQP